MGPGHRSDEREEQEAVLHGEFQPLENRLYPDLPPDPGGQSGTGQKVCRRTGKVERRSEETLVPAGLRPRDASEQGAACTGAAVCLYSDADSDAARKENDIEMEKADD